MLAHHRLSILVEAESIFKIGARPQKLNPVVALKAKGRESAWELYPLDLRINSTLEPSSA
jgi:hypothetical protein